MCRLVGQRNETRPPPARDRASRGRQAGGLEEASQMLGGCARAWLVSALSLFEEEEVCKMLPEKEELKCAPFEIERLMRVEAKRRMFIA